MFNASEDNQIKEKPNPGKKLGVFFLVFLILLITVFIYLYLYPLYSRTTIQTVKPAVPKTDEEKIKANMELVKQGYGDYISGEIKAISEDKKKITINSIVKGEEKNYVVSINDKTAIIKTTIIKKEGLTDNEKKELIDDDREIYEDNTEYETISLKADDIKIGSSIGANLSKFMKLDEETDFIANKIYITEKTQQEEVQLENIKEEDIKI